MDDYTRTVTCRIVLMGLCGKTPAAEEKTPSAGENINEETPLVQMEILDLVSCQLYIISDPGSKLAYTIQQSLREWGWIGSDADS